MTTIASWNVNSIRVRFNQVSNFLNKVDPDILLLQEIKCLNDEFPNFFDKSKYNVIVNGQKAKYGVAIIHKKEIDVEKIKIENETLENQARVQQIHLKSINLNILNVYTPNGNPINDDEKFKFKLKWYDELYNLSKKINFSKEDLLIGGDFNVIENVRDALNFQQWENDALGDIKVRTKFRELCSLGLINLSRIFFKPGQIFSFWDYQRACWERNDGILIDHFLISPKKLQNVTQLKYESSFRGLEKPSDHIPFWLKLNI